MKSNELDLRGIACPMNMVMVRLSLEEMSSGEELEMILDDGEPMVNITRSLKEDGQRVLQVAPDNAGGWRVRVLKV